MNAAIEAKIRMLKCSLHCYVCGLLGLLPVIGLPFAIAALVMSGNVRAGQKKYWNAGRPCWIWGLVCAIVGPVFWGFILFLIILAKIQT
jgi:hypothetical protein